MTEYKSCRIIDGKPRWVIVENGKIINKKPGKEELKCLDEEQFKRSRIKIYNLINTCDSVSRN